jgi:predicted DNA-binding protein with PD1-like motif
MKYSKGSIGRVYVVKFDDGEDLNIEMEKLVRKEKIKTGFFFFLGGLRQGDIVSGPKKPVIPPDPYWHSFDGAWEVFGSGSVFTGKQGPQVHIHTSMGKKKKALTGCVRKNSKVFITVEAVFYELKGVKAAKEIDEATGVNMLKILAGGGR